VLELNKEEVWARHHIKPSDLNSADRLFGGQMLLWIDDCAAQYAMYQLDTTSVVTAKISEVHFKRPAFQGDILEFFVSTVDIGKTSLTVRVRVIARGERQEIVDCTLVFVHIGSDGHSCRHLKDI
jgi:acyl-CoA hydrolase